MQFTYLSPLYFKSFLIYNSASVMQVVISPPSLGIMARTKKLHMLSTDLQAAHSWLTLLHSSQLVESKDSEHKDTEGRWPVSLSETQRLLQDPVPGGHLLVGILNSP